MWLACCICCPCGCLQGASSESASRGAILPRAYALACTRVFRKQGHLETRGLLIKLRSRK